MSSSEEHIPNPVALKHDESAIKKDVLIIIKNIKGTEISEMIPDVALDSCINEERDLMLSKLLDELKQKYHVPVQNHQISYWLGSGEIFMHCGSDPISEQITISEEEYTGNKEIKIRTKMVPVSLIHKIMSEEVNETMMHERENHEGEQADSNKCRRTKERRIGYIIDKVVKWRQYYAGIKENGEAQAKRYSLEEAATKVGISKKSLDDYLLQIRFGRKYGFNFNEHKNDKVGVLRDYVRKNKKERKNRENAQRGDDKKA